MIITKLILNDQGGAWVTNVFKQRNPIDEARPKVTQDSYSSNLVSLQTFEGHPFHKQD